jgi:hypothetical protein
MSASEFEGHEALITALRAGTLDAPDHLQRRVLAGGSVKRRRWAEMSGRRRALVVVPVAAALAVGAAVVQAAFFSGSKPAAHHAALGTVLLRPHEAATRANGAAGANGAIGANGPTGAKGPTGAAGATGANGATGLAAPTAAHGTSFDAAAPAAREKTLSSLNQSQQAVTIPKGRLVHADARLQVAVANHAALTRATNDATQIVTGLGGYAQNVEYQASRQGYGRAYLDLHVPLRRVEAAIAKLGGLGRLVSQSISTQDLQQQFTRQTSRIGQLRRAIAIYQQALQSGTLSGSQRVEVQIRLANAEHEITATRKSRSHTVASGTTADVQLTLTMSQHHHAVVHPGKRGRLGRLLHNAGDFLGLEGIIVLYALIVAFPIVLLVALLWWLMRERRRREEKLLANA